MWSNFVVVVLDQAVIQIFDISKEFSGPEPDSSRVTLFAALALENDISFIDKVGFLENVSQSDVTRLPLVIHCWMNKLHTIHLVTESSTTGESRFHIEYGAVEETFGDSGYCMSFAVGRSGTYFSSLHLSYEVSSYNTGQFIISRISEDGTSFLTKGHPISMVGLPLAHWYPVFDFDDFTGLLVLGFESGDLIMLRFATTPSKNAHFEHPRNIGETDKVWKTYTASQY